MSDNTIPVVVPIGSSASTAQGALWRKLREIESAATTALHLGTRDIEAWERVRQRAHEARKILGALEEENPITLKEMHR